MKKHRESVSSNLHSVGVTDRPGVARFFPSQDHLVVGGLRDDLANVWTENSSFLDDLSSIVDTVSGVLGDGTLFDFESFKLANLGDYNEDADDLL